MAKKKRALSKARRIGKAPRRSVQSIGLNTNLSGSDLPIITSLVARAVTVPMKRPLYVATGAVEHAALVLIDIETSAGITGRSYLFAFTPPMQAAIVSILQGMAAMIEGDEVSPFDIERKLRAKHRLIGLQNVVMFAISGIDMAIWDAHAKSTDQPLVCALGGSVRPVRAYNSNGLGIMPADALEQEAEQLVAEGFNAVKMRLGRATAQEDLIAIRAVKKAIGSEVTLMCDFNQGLTVAEAIHRGRMIDDEGGMSWIEEPVLADDYRGLKKITAALQTPVSIGENFMGPEQMTDALSAECCDYVMPDVQRISGVSGWMRAAALADASGVEMSSHLFPEVSCHLLGVTPTAHWLEYVDWARPVLLQSHQIKDGAMLIPEQPGNGLDWDEKAVKKYTCQ